MRGQAKSYDALRDYCETLPVIDCHDHSWECGPNTTDPFLLILRGYFRSDIQSASSDAEVLFMEDVSQPFEERWKVFEKAWKRTCYTGYAQVTRRTLKKFYGEDDLSLAAMYRLQEKMLNIADPVVYENILEEAHIAVRLADVWPDVKKIIAGTYTLPPRSRLVISLPAYHGIRDYAAVEANTSPLGKHITSLDEYLDACRQIFQIQKDYGAIAFKDQSAYTRSIAYDNPTRAQAEEVFNWFMEDPRRSASYPDGIKPLSDYLFHQFMRMARDMDLPVQIHTGHMAGIRNEIRKTNAIGLTKLLELHRDVRFDLFHANWPYSGEMLYLGKNFPNVAIDFCWANIIDPIYCQQMFEQAVSSVPHGKIHGYGTDYFGGCADLAWGHAAIARDNIAIALSNLVEMEYLDIDGAKKIAYDWLYGNAVEFFRLSGD